MATATTYVELPRESAAPERATVSELRRLGSFGRGALWSVAFLPDGRPVSVGGFGLRVHDPDTLEVSRTIPLGLGARRISIHPSGAYALIVGVVGERVALAEVNLDDGAVRLVPDHRPAGWHGGEGLVWSADGRRGFFGAGASLYVWDRETGETQLWGPPTNEALPMQRWVAVATGEVTFKREERTMRHGQWVAASSDGRWVVASDGDVQTVWDAQTGEAVRTLKNDLDGLAFGPDGRLLMGDGHRLAQVDITTAEVQLTAMNLPSGGPDVVAVSPSGRFVVSASTWGDARVQSLPGPEPVGVVGGVRSGGGWTGYTLDVAACAEERLLVYDSRRAELSLYRLPDLRPLATLAGHSWGLIDVSAADDLSRLIWLTDGERTLWELEVSTGAVQERGGRVYRAALSPHGGLLALGVGYNFAKKELTVTDAAGAALDRFDSRSGLRPLRFSPSGALYAVCEGTNDGYRDGKPGEVSIRAPGRPRVIKRLKLPKTPWVADISRDDARVAVVWDDGAGLYSLPKGAELLKVRLPEYGEIVAAHPTAPRLAVSCALRGGRGAIGDVLLYEAGTLGPAARLAPHAPATAMAFSARGELLYVGLEDGTLLVLDGETLAELKRLRAHVEPIRVVQVTSRGALTCALDGQILLFGV